MEEQCGCEYRPHRDTTTLLKPISKKAQNILRHELHFREPDGAASLPTLMRRMFDYNHNTRLGWTRYQLHQTGLEMNIVLAHMKDLSTSEQYKVIMAHQGWNQHS